MLEHCSICGASLETLRPLAFAERAPYSLDFGGVSLVLPGEVAVKLFQRRGIVTGIHGARCEKVEFIARRYPAAMPALLQRCFDQSQVVYLEQTVKDFCRRPICANLCADHVDRFKIYGDILETAKETDIIVQYINSRLNNSRYYHINPCYFKVNLRPKMMHLYRVWSCGACVEPTRDPADSLAIL